MKKLLLIVFLIFSGLFLVAEIFTQFKTVRAMYYSLNFEKNFVVKKFYYKDSYPGTGDNMASGGNWVLKGCLEGTTKDISLTVSEKNIIKYSKFDDEKDDYYYDVWYNEKLNMFFLKGKEKTQISF